MGINRDLYEFNTHPFVVKVWLEETVEEAGQATWRGYITHVPTGKQKYLKSLDEIPTFIRPYLEALGVDFDAGSWLCRWSKWLRSYLDRTFFRGC